MSSDEIRKLLGGYATNTLTESERNALFEAALDDQELFNALQQEQALKSVLRDPVARAEVRQALDRPRAAVSRWWVWGGAIGTFATAAVLLAVFWPRPNVLEKPVQIASAERLQKPIPAEQPKQLAQAKPPVRQRTRSSDAEDRFLKSPGAPAGATAQRASTTPETPAAATGAAPAPAPPPAIPSPVQAQQIPRYEQQGPGPAPFSQGSKMRDQSISSSARNGFTASSSNASLQQTSTLRYSLLKQSVSTKDLAPVTEADLKLGDLIRIQVSSATSGRVVLTRLTPSGEWQPVETVTAAVNTSYLLPSDPIPVTANPQKFRLTLEPRLPQAKTVSGRAQPSSQTSSAAIEITIGENAR